jgi:signal transduction histidine kinase
MPERVRDLTRRLRGIDPHALDALVALAFTAAALWTVAERVGGDDAFRHDDFFGIGLLLLQTLPIAARSVAPLGALTVSVAAISLHIAIGYEGVPAGTFAALVILYSAASLTDIRQGIIAALITAAGITIYFATDRGDPGPTQAVTTYATYAAGWGLGMYARSRREYTNVVEERASLLEREREARAREAVADERARIARELHDMVGHALNLIVIQSGGAQRVFQSKPELARDSLASIESTGRQALMDMERMLGILRGTEEADGALSPQPGLSHVEDLAAQVSQAGLPVEVTVEGTPVTLPSSVDLSAYRIIQEALTNALKHAGPAHASVKIRHGPDSLELEITDDGQGASGEGAGDDQGGRGLIGMRERVGLFGGELSVGPQPGGGFRVHVRLPLGGGPE